MTELAIACAIAFFVWWGIRAYHVPVTVRIPDPAGAALAVACGALLFLATTWITGATIHRYLSWPAPLIAASNIILQPAIEEALFRGVSIELSRRWTSRDYPGLLVGAAAFAAIHLGHRPWDYVLLFGGGLLLGLLYLWRRNLALPVIAHMVINLLVLVLTRP